MKKVNGKRVLAGALAVSMALGLTACGGKKEVTNSDVKYYRANYEEKMPATFQNLSNDPVVNGSTIYYGAYDKDYTKNGIYSYNFDTKEEITYYVQENSNYDPLAGNSYLERFLVDKDGNVYLYMNSTTVDTTNMPDYSNTTLDDIIAYMVENWGYEDENAAIADWNEYNEKSYIEQGYVLEDGSVDYAKVLTEWNSWNLPRTYTYNLKKVDKAGNELYDIALGGETSGDISRYVQGMVVGADNTLYMCYEEWSNTDTSSKNMIIAYDETGAVKKSVELTNYVNGMVSLADGSVGTLGWGDNGGFVISILDPQTLQSTNEIDLGNTYADRVQALDEENLLFSSDGKLYKYNIAKKEKEVYFSWLDANISSNSVRGFSILEDGRILVTTSSYNYSTYETTTDIAIVEEIPAEEAANIKTITLACIYTDEQLENRIIEINKKNPQTRIHVETYYQDYGDKDYVDAMNEFTTAMASDPNNDIIYFNGGSPYANMMNFAAKGLLIDLGQFIDQDEELKREDFMESILDACTYDGKLVGVPEGFSLQTLVGKVSDVGTTPGWTFAQMKALLDSKEPGTQLVYGRTRQWALEMCLNLGYKQFIDMEKASCNFDSKEFMEILEFAKMFPEEFEWQEGVDETELMNSGKVLLAEYGVSDFNEIQLLSAIFGDKLTYIGYPTAEGNGAMFDLHSCFAITKNCKDTDTAWKLVRQYLLPTQTDDNEYKGYYRNGLSIRHDDFDKFCENAMKQENNGSWGWGSFEVEIKPATREQVDEVKALIAGTTAVNGTMSSAMMNIINEEAAAYFSGQKSVEEVAKIIQSRMQVYLSETN